MLLKLIEWYKTQNPSIVSWIEEISKERNPKQNFKFDFRDIEKAKK